MQPQKTQKTQRISFVTFVLLCRRVFVVCANFSERGLSDSDFGVSPAKHVLSGIEGARSSEYRISFPLRLCAFAGDHSEFGCGVSRAVLFAVKISLQCCAVSVK
jgi:hypothetical protein